MGFFSSSLHFFLNALRGFKVWYCRRRKLREFFASTSDEQIRRDSYHGSAELKPVSVVKDELKKLYLAGKGGVTPEATYACYMMAGLDRVDRSCDDYLFGLEFCRLRDLHKPGFAKILDHKIYTLVYLQARGIRVSRILGQVSAERLFLSMDGRVQEDFYAWFEKHQTPVFCKLPNGYQGTSCFVLERRGDVYLKSDKPVSREELDTLLPHLQIEEVIQQHPDMAAIYPYAVNTCRIVTVSKNANPQFFSGFCLFGCGGTRVSNGHSGGIVIGFDDEGRLKDYGIRSLVYGGGVYEKHPDTDVAFKERSIPYFHEAMELVIAAHRVMNEIPSIGWDVAITPDGPVIIEGNQGWGPVDHQFFAGGLRERAYEMLG